MSCSKYFVYSKYYYYFKYFTSIEIKLEKISNFKNHNKKIHIKLNDRKNDYNINWSNERKERNSMDSMALVINISESLEPLCQSVVLIDYHNRMMPRSNLCYQK